MKKTVALLLIVIFVLTCVCGCSSSSGKKASSKNTSIISSNSSSDSSSDNSSVSAQSSSSTVATSVAVSAISSLSSSINSSQSQSSHQTSSNASSVAPVSQSSISSVSKENDVPMTGKKVEFIGRFKKTDNGTYIFGWSGTTIEAGFVGTEITAGLKINGTNTEDFVEVIVDDREPVCVQITKNTNSYKLASGLSNSYHKIQVVKRTEAFVGELEFSGFDYGQGKESNLPARKTRRIEFFGDSITAGYGNEGPQAWSGFKAAEENAYKSYGMLVAKQLDAECSIIAWSGAGVSQDLDKWPTNIIEKFFGRTLPLKYANDWDFNAWVPDTVVINAGTNDFANGASPVNYAVKYNDLLKLVRGKYPKAHIFCVMGPLSYNACSDIKKAVTDFNASGDKNTSYFQFSPKNVAVDGEGTDGHPSAKTHIKMADELGKEIKAKMGW